jgi:hypothetical protein
MLVDKQAPSTRVPICDEGNAVRNLHAARDGPLLYILFQSFV